MTAASHDLELGTVSTFPAPVSFGRGQQEHGLTRVLWDNGRVTIESDNGETVDPICPNCNRPLRGNLRSERLDAQTSVGQQSRVGFIYCGACGWPLHIDAHSPFVVGGAVGARVASPTDEASLGGQFQLRCRDLISKIRALGFNPFVWVGLINDLGAVGAA